MIIIAEANMLPGLTDADKKVLLGMSASDRVIVLSDKKSSVPIDTMQLFMAMKAKTEFIQLDDLKMGFGLGYRYGKFSETFTKEKVKILTNNDYSAVLSANMTCVKTLTTSTKKTTPAKKSTAKTVSEPVKKATTKTAGKATPKETKPAKAEGTKATSKKAVALEEDSEKKTTTRRPKLKDLSPNSLLATYPALDPYKTKILMLNGMLVDAIKKSTDPNISFKMQLQMVFADDGEEIWKIIKKDFAKLKLLAEA